MHYKIRSRQTRIRRRFLRTLTVSVSASLAASALAASTPEASTAQAVTPKPRAHESPPPAESIPTTVRQVLDRAQHALATGKAAAAADLFESAVRQGEYTEAEVGEVRARLWAGQFRHAVTISTVVAGEHPESAEAQALLGYIEDRSGYTAQALQRLRAEQNVHPSEPAPVAAEAEILIDRHSAPEALALIDRWTAAHGPQPDICRLRTRAAVIQSVSAGALAVATGSHGSASPAATSQTSSAATARTSAARASASQITALQTAESRTAEPQTTARQTTASHAAASRTGAPQISASPCAASARRPRGDDNTSAIASRWPEPTATKFPTTLGPPIAAGNGLITDDGRHVVTLRRLVELPSASVWVRNARGELRQARLGAAPGLPTEAGGQTAAADQAAAARQAPAPDMATTITLSLNAPFTADQSLPRAQYSLEDEHDAHQDAHGLCFALGFPAALSTDGMLPAVTPCFTFNATLNIPLSAVESGTPIFDAQGRLLGLANPPNAAATSSGPRDATATAPGGRAIATRTTVIRIQPAHGGAPTDAGGEVPTHTDDTTPSNAAGGHQATAPMPELYERLAPTVAQILVFSTSEATARASER